MPTLEQTREEASKIKSHVPCGTSDFDEITYTVDAPNKVVTAYIYELRCKDCKKNGRPDLVFHGQYYG